MRNSQVIRRINLDVEETEEQNEDEDTKVLINIPLAETYKKGISLSALNDLIEQSTKELSAYRIYHDPKGLVICGTYKVNTK